MTCEVRGPSCLPRDAKPIGDFRPQADFKANARRGSKRLLQAILKLQRPPKVRGIRRYGTWEERQLAIAQIERLQRTVAEHYRLDPAVMVMRTRGHPEIAHKRQIAMFLAREVIQSSFPDIAKSFGGRDHTTVIHAVDSVRERMGDPDVANEVATLRERLRA